MSIAFATCVMLSFQKGLNYVRTNVDGALSTAVNVIPMHNTDLQVATEPIFPAKM